MYAVTSDRSEQPRGGRRLLRPRFLAAAGVLLLLAGLIAFTAIITSEALYDGYSLSGNAISDLGATEPPNSIIKQPSAMIFNTGMIVSGLLIVGAAYCLGKGSKRAAVAILTGLMGLGILGVGVFPGNYGNTHALFALLAFSAGGLAAIMSHTVQSPPLSVVSIILGVVSLATLVLYMILGDDGLVAGLGIGGLERLVAYPLLVWMLSFGGYLMGRAR
jgi:hypothetical membrane protein